MLRHYNRKPPGRPKLNKADPNISHMRVSQELKDLLEAEIQGRETLSECALRLIRYRGKKVVALLQELDYANIHIDKLKKLMEEPIPYNTTS